MSRNRLPSPQVAICKHKESHSCSPSNVYVSRPFLLCNSGFQSLFKRPGPLVIYLPPSGIRVLELTTDRKRDAAMRRQVFGEIAASLA